MATELHLTQDLIDLYIRVAFENKNGVYDILNSLGKMKNNKPTSVLETGNLTPPDGNIDYFTRGGDYLTGYRAKHIPTKEIINNEISVKFPINKSDYIKYNNALSDFVNYKTIKWKVSYASATSNIVTFFSDHVILTVWNKDGNWNISALNENRINMILHSIIYDNTNPRDFQRLMDYTMGYPINLTT